MARSQAHLRIRPVKIGKVSQIHSSRQLRSQLSDPLSSSHSTTSALCQCHNAEQSSIVSQRQQIREIQLRLNEIQHKLSLLPADADQTSRVALEDKIITLQWSLSDQRERLDSLIRKQKKEGG